MKARVNSVVLELSMKEVNYLRRITLTNWMGKLTPCEAENDDDKQIREEIYNEIDKILRIK